MANPSEVIKDGAGSKAPVGDDPCFYAIANGKHPGVYTDYHKAVDYFFGNCYQLFGTRDEAEAFITKTGKTPTPMCADWR